MRYIISISLASLLTFTVAQADVPRVVTDLPPIGSLVAQVMGDLGTPVVLLDAGADAHAFQLRPSQAAELAAAQAIIWVGPEMSPWLDRAMNGLNASAVDLRLLAVPGMIHRTYADDHAEDEHAAHNHAEETGALETGALETGAAELVHDDHAAEGHEDHDHADGDIDPHAWLDPANASLWLGAIATTLADLDPANAAIYAANAAMAQDELAVLDTEIATLLAPAQTTPLVVFHNAYGYFAAHYGLTIAGAISDGDAASPGAAHLRNLQTKLADSVACVFPESNHDPKLLEILEQNPGLRLSGALDPEGSTLQNGPELYGDLLRALAQTIADCAAS